MTNIIGILENSHIFLTESIIMENQNTPSEGVRQPILSRFLPSTKSYPVLVSSLGITNVLGLIY